MYMYIYIYLCTFRRENTCRVHCAGKSSHGCIAVESSVTHPSDRNCSSMYVEMQTSSLAAWTAFVFITPHSCILRVSSHL